MTHKTDAEEPPATHKPAGGEVMTTSGLAEPGEELVHARAAWSALVEPGDVIAAALIDALGPLEALEHLRSWISRGSAQAVGDLPAQACSALAGRCAPRLAQLDVPAEIAQHARLGGWICTPEDPAWPAGLNDLAAPPTALWVRGQLAASLSSLRGERGAAPVAFVGSRTATAYGQRVTAEISVPLAERGHAIISGGAFGIDIAAHRAALASEGYTVAVMAGGLGHLYPRAHGDHFERIAQAGALISELPPLAEPRRHRFLSRNRIIAALAAGTVVVEAGLRSGALRTARDATEIGRPVGAVPGPVTSMMSAGCHELLRRGQATLVTDGEDVRELVSGFVALSDDPVQERRAPEGGLLAGLFDGLSPHASQVLDAMPVRAARDVPELAVAAGLSISAVRAALGVLELEGRVQRVARGWKRRSPTASP